MIVLLGGKNRDLLNGRDITKIELHAKTIHLSFRQRVSATEFHRILRGNNKKQASQVSSLTVHAYLAFTHGFQQSGLRAGRCPVDFIRQKNIRKNWPLVKMKLLIALAIN